jgi:hypothetical protein
MISLIKLNKKVDNKIDVVKQFLGIYCKVKDIKLSDTEITVLAYFILYGIKDETINLIFSSKISNPDSFKNILSKLRKNNFISKRNKDDILNEDFKLNFDQNTIALLIKINA